MDDGVIRSVTVCIDAPNRLPFPSALAAYRLAQVGFQHHLLTHGTQSHPHNLPPISPDGRVCSTYCHSWKFDGRTSQRITVPAN